MSRAQFLCFTRSELQALSVQHADSPLTVGPCGCRRNRTSLPSFFVLYGRHERGRVWGCVPGRRYRLSSTLEYQGRGRRGQPSRVVPSAYQMLMLPHRFLWEVLPVITDERLHHNDRVTWRGRVCCSPLRVLRGPRCCRMRPCGCR